MSRPGAMLALVDPAFVRTLADELLAVAVAVLTPDPGDPDDPRTDPPAAQYVAHGLAFAWDCELVAASVVRVILDRGDDRGHGRACALIPRVSLAVTLLRCYPKSGDDGEPIPAPETIEAAARMLAVDAAALSGGLVDAWADGSLFSSVGCGQVTIAPGVEPLGPDGGLAGWRMTFDVRG